ncbi:MAG: phosphoesterase [Acidobacteria bacterium]|nr:MAG: phosphoesterase [Acidobacteriota bacterium]REK06397.1 MAG: phosphoesterase [Acidobacteriota bacterium]
MSRRKLLGYLLGTGLGATFGAGLYTWRVEPHWVEIVHRVLAVRDLPPSLEGALLVQLSDLHVGPEVSDSYLRACFDRVRELEPQFVAITGDWVTYRGPWQLDQLRHVLSRIPLGEIATVGILGNHDYGANWSQPEVAGEIADIVTSSGVTLLRNERFEDRGLVFVGLDDLWGPGFDVEKALSAHRPTTPAIALCHNPDAVDRPGWENFSGWILAGHTHGGQCKPPFLAPPLLPVVNKRYTRGEFSLNDGRSLYINRGLGHLLQVRFNVRPEITAFTLTSREPRPVA